MLQRTEIAPLTGLRAVAAIYVFLFHIQIRWPFVHHPFAANLVGEGAVGMSIFFMLSGFVLAYQYANRSVSHREYAINRFARIYPVYALCAVLSLPWIGLSIHDGTVLRDAARIVILVIANVFVVQAWFPQFFQYWNDGGSWSIAVEAFCYALLPLILASLESASRRKLGMVAIASYFAAVLPGLTYALFENSPTIFYAMPIFRLPEFLIGVCVCLAVRRGHVVCWWAAAILVFACIWYLGTTPLEGTTIYVTHNWLVLPAIAAAICFLATSTGYASKMLASRIATFLGKISYCIYSLQIFIIMPLVHNHDRVVSRIPILGNNVILVCAAFALLIAGSALCHYLIEEPARRWIKSRMEIRGVREAAVLRPQTPR
ncbi:acyltransferase [Paraburkholderia terrae]|uniref:acyltransferase family protein n=1 Tax=Paraburkholderia terrae TaxID=311230 RepID=UPI001EE17344|nr:acyltransferase [Paraburkholderia terrae]GJH05046.1 acyltransferase [Paraburkholderia terrae]